MTDETNTDQGASGADDQTTEQQTYSAEEFQTMQSQFQQKLESQSTETAAMKAKMDTLLKETKIAKKAKIESENLAQLEAAKKTQSLSELEAAMKSQFDTTLSEKDSKIETLNKLLLGGREQTARAKLASSFNDSEFGDFMLKGMTKSEIVDGEIVTNFFGRDGSLVATNEEDMLNWLKNDSVFKKHLKGVQSSGMQDTGGTPRKTSSTQDQKISREEWEKLPPSEKARQAKNIE